MVLLAVLAAAPAPLEVSRLVQAPPAEVYKTFTARDGLVRFLAPDVRFSLTANGPFEALFVPEAPAGQKGGEGCVVKSWVDGKSFTFTWNFPPSLQALRDANARTEVEVTFVAQGRDTKVTLTQRGWKEGADWAAGRAYFERAWSIVLARLARVMAGGSIDWKHAWRPVKVNELAFLQGAWRSTSAKDVTEETWLLDGSSGGMWARERKVEAKEADFTEVGELEPAGDEVFLNVRMLGVGLGNHPKDRARFVLEELDEQTARFVETKKNGLMLTYTRKNDELHIELAFPKGTEHRVLARVL
jgi:uncharacterized protein YndB with AHSA1/START domain